MKKHVYFFGEGNKDMKELLGGKGANLNEMVNLGIPVPPGFTITTEVCDLYYKNNRKYPAGVMEQVEDNLKRLEKAIGAKFGDAENPLLVSVRSGAAASMPGMMDTVLNLGLNDKTVQGLIKKTGNERFVYDAYRRFIQMFGDVVMGVEHEKFEESLQKVKETKGVEYDTELDAKDLKRVVDEYKGIIKRENERGFPDDAMEQLQMAVDAVFSSWNNQRAITYRRLHDIRGLLGTAVNIQAMVFGNMGEDSGTGVLFTRNPSTGESHFYGEFLMNAQGEDVVAGIRTPIPIEELKRVNKGIYEELVKIYKNVEKHYKDMQDMEFTIQEGKLYILQTRNGKRTAFAAVRIAVEMEEEGLIDKKSAVLRVHPGQLDQLLHKRLDPVAKGKAKVIARGLPASPGAAVGTVVFNAEDAVEKSKAGERVVLVRTETSPEDIQGMAVAQGILTARGGMTCVAGESRVLTDKGFFTATEVFDLLKSGIKNLHILSYNAKINKTRWKRIIAGGRRISDTVVINVSQTGRTNNNFLRITPDHKMLTFINRDLIKKPLNKVLEDEEHICIVDKLPELDFYSSNEKLAFLVGAILSDGYINLGRTKGYVTFTQKETEEKKQFIDAVDNYFSEVFDENFNIKRVKYSNNYIGGRLLAGNATDLICTKVEPARKLVKITQNLVPWLMSLDEDSTLNFLAGLIDGDGSFSNNRLQLYISKQHILQGVVCACLKLGIVPQVTVNRNIYNVQIVERVNDILGYTKRIKGFGKTKKYGSKLFSAKQLFSDIIKDINYMGRTKGMIRRNLLFDSEKILRDIVPMCDKKIKGRLLSLLNSDLRMYRVKTKGIRQPDYVYNFEVESRDELDKNFVVFTSRYTPLLVSNSHAAVVARGMGKCCVAGCSDLNVNEKKKEFHAKDDVFKEGDWITLDGSTGEVIKGQVPVVDPELSGDFAKLMKWADDFRKLRVRTNADTPHDSQVARGFGAEGIGLCRTEHMFFEGDRIKAVREMILAHDLEGRKRALAKLLPMQRSDFISIFKVMKGLPVTIRLLDPPLHEFLPQEEKDIEELSGEMHVSVDKLKNKIKELHELNPMLGHRGCRLAITYPEIAEMQTRAIIEAACEIKKSGEDIKPEIMVPLVGHISEFKAVKEIIIETAERLMKEKNVKLDYSIGTMIEVPRGAITADEIAAEAEFFSFGTNDLTQMAFGFSRDDAGKFVPEYIEKGILEKDPFQTIDQAGVGELMKIAVEKGRKARKGLKLGVCGEHGGDPASVIFCHEIGLDYVSCSPFRVPIARLAAAHAVLKKK